MKNNILFRFAAMAFAAVVMCVVPSCEDPIEEPDPNNSQTNNNNNENNGNNGNNENNQEAAANFPELVENYEVAPGSELIVKFTPNYNWQISVPSEVFKYFWILDNGFKVEKLSGTASDKEVRVKIMVSEEEEFDTNRSCDVTLTMNGESKVVAKYMRPAKNRTLAAYAAQLDTEGNLIPGEDGKPYQYGTDEAESVSLVWSESDADFRLPVKVDANCEWQVEVPEWLDVEVPEKTTGVVELLFKGESLTEQTGKITFKAGDQVLKELDVTIPSCAGVEVYAAKYTEGEFEYGEDGYVYESTPAAELGLVWLGSDFRLPVQVSTKCEWTLAMPEWVTAELPDKTAGVINLTLMGVPSKYPLEDTEGKVKFMYGDKVLYEITVKIPGCKDIMSYSIDMSLTEFNYNAAGWVNTSSGYVNMKATGSIFGTKDVKVFAVETTGGVVGAAPSWFNVTLANYVTASGSDVLQERDVTFDIQPNEGYNERSAIVFFLTPSMSDKVSDLFNEDATVKDDYIKYSVKVHQMSSVYEDYLEISSVEDMTEYTFDKKSDVDEIIDIFGDTDHVYALNYTAEYSKVWVNLAVAYHSYKVFSSSFSDKTADESFWLKFDASESKIYGAFTMYMEQELPEEPSTGYVVFYDSKKNVLAIVECISPCKEEEEVVTPPADDVEYLTDAYGNSYIENTSYFSDPEAAAAAGIKMYELKEGYYYDRYKAHNTKDHSCALLILEYPSSDVETELTLPSEVKIWSAYPMTWAYNEYVKVNDTSYGTSSGILKSATNKITIQMSEFIAENMDLVESITNDKDAGFPILLNDAQDQDPEFVIYCRIRVTK